MRTTVGFKNYPHFSYFFSKQSPILLHELSLIFVFKKQWHHLSLHFAGPHFLTSWWKKGHLKTRQYTPFTSVFTYWTITSLKSRHEIHLAIESASKVFWKLYVLQYDWKWRDNSPKIVEVQIMSLCYYPPPTIRRMYYGSQVYLQHLHMYIWITGTVFSSLLLQSCIQNSRPGVAHCECYSLQHM